MDLFAAGPIAMDIRTSFPENWYFFIMHKGKFILAQLTDYINQYEFNKFVEMYKGNYKVKDFSCWNQFVCMMFGQLTHRESIPEKQIKQQCSFIVCLKFLLILLFCH
ncbi:MAG: DUF4372 domain-containing protein [Bacteroidales bacterium]|nr:DUF4372 domain-containing protein [Bacteroidales bacterium]